MVGTFTAVAVYVAINVLINVGLAIWVIRLRFLTRTSQGHGGNIDLQWAVRSHGNNAEYAPFALASFVLLALLDAPPFVAHLVGITYTAGRLIMGYALAFQHGRGALRKIGMSLNFFSLISCAVALFVLASELDN